MTKVRYFFNYHTSRLEERGEREIFKVSRGYKELAERLNMERIVNNEYLPGDVISAVNDDTVDIEHLLGEKTGAAAGDDNNDEVITYLIVTKNTLGKLDHTQSRPDI